MRKYITGAGLILTLALLFAGCSTINRLDEWDLTDSRIALDMKAPPEPTVNVDYHLGYYGEGSELLAIIEFGTNLLKADEARKAEEKLYSALAGLYLPEFVAELTYDRMIKTLNAYAVDKVRDSDVILEVDIEEYGIQSWSSSGYVELVINMEVRLWHRVDREIIWQRHVGVSQELTPGFFGFDNIIGNAVTIASLGNLTEEELSDGFQKLTIEIMKETIGILQDDLREARYR
ncbi:MAG: hypothetical protein JEZ04_02725 [Spirochaetales bacterium]|nr:hypothetical protein [Spirochaetales bacterium]